MLTVAHDAKEGKMKTVLLNLAFLVVGGVLTAVVLTLGKKPLQKLEAAVS